MFLSAENALHWAYNTVNRPIVKMSAINYMRQVPTRGAVNLLLIDLNPQDQHGQAAQIIGMLERLPQQVDREYLKAKFGRELSQDDLKVVVSFCRMALGFGPEKATAVYRMVLSYFDGSMSHRDVRRILGCRDQYAVMVRRCLGETLDVIHAQAIREITEVLREHGLVRSDSSYA